MTVPAICRPVLDMLRSKPQPSSRQVLGTPLWLFVAPICLFALATNRTKERVLMFTPQGDDPHEWISTEFCNDCGHHVAHSFKEWVDEGVVESKCGECGVPSSYVDAK